jgi:uncharacterized protein (TIGR02147 family)
MLTNCSGYRTYLKETFADRIRRNPAYSMRAFASQIGIAPSMLSNVLNGKKHLSVVRAFSVAKNLGLQGEEADLFCLLVQLETTEDFSQKEALLARIKAIRPESNTKDLSLDVFKSIADWTHVTILALLDLRAFATAATDAVARKLGVSKIEAETALNRLVRLGLLARAGPTGPYRRAHHDTLVVRSGLPNKALREFHRSMLERAAASLEAQTNEEKIVGSETLAFAPDQLPEISRVIEECARKIHAIAEKSLKRSEVYHFGFQFFRVTQKEKGKNV